LVDRIVEEAPGQNDAAGTLPVTGNQGQGNSPDGTIAAADAATNRQGFALLLQFKRDAPAVELIKVCAHYALQEKSLTKPDRDVKNAQEQTL
jgi:hypothetical protein